MPITSYGGGPYGGLADVPMWETYRPVCWPVTDSYITLDGWCAPAEDEDGTEWVLTSVDGWSGQVEVRTALTARPADHGSFDSPSFYGSRVMTIEGTALSVSREMSMKAKDTIGSVASDPVGLFPLVVCEPGRPDRQVTVRLNGPTKVSPVYGGYAFDFQLQLVAPDPRRYAVEPTTLQVGVPSIGDSGLTFPLTAPFGSTGTGGSSRTALNEGTAATRPLVTFHGPLTNPRLTNVKVGKTLAFNYDLPDGYTLVCDFDARSVLLNNEASRTYAIAPSASWWELQPGPNDLVLTSTQGTGWADVLFRSAWY